jgi:hypothetical protein
MKGRRAPKGESARLGGEKRVYMGRSGSTWLLYRARQSKPVEGTRTYRGRVMSGRQNGELILWGFGGAALAVQLPSSIHYWTRSLLELMIPPHYRLGSTVVVRPSRFGVVPGSIPGLAILFSSYKACLTRPARGRSEGEGTRGELKVSKGEQIRYSDYGTGSPAIHVI